MHRDKRRTRILTFLKVLSLLDLSNYYKIIIRLFYQISFVEFAQQFETR